MNLEYPTFHFQRNTYHKVTTEHITQPIKPSRLIYNLTIMQRNNIFMKK